VSDYLTAAEYGALYAIPAGVLFGLFIFGCLRLMRRARHGLQPVRWQRDAIVGSRFGAVALAFVGIPLFGIGVMFGGMFGHEVPHVTVSPDGQHQALVFEGDSGATDHFHTFVSVLPKNKQLGEHEAGNAFGVDGNQIVHVLWIDATHLHVEYPAQSEAQVHFRKNRVNGVYIEYAGVQ
jgi:hypothetical protein